jgi:hypothetical protein
MEEAFLKIDTPTSRNSTVSSTVGYEPVAELENFSSAGQASRKHFFVPMVVITR